MYKRFETKKAWVVHNFNGYDELTTVSKNKVVEIKNGIISEKKLLIQKRLVLKHSEKELLEVMQKKMLVMKKYFRVKQDLLKIILY